MLRSCAPLRQFFPIKKKSHSAKKCKANKFDYPYARENLAPNWLQFNRSKASAFLSKADYKATSLANWMKTRREILTSKLLK